MPGKISVVDFNEIILPRNGSSRQEVIAGPEFGVDVSLVALPGNMGLAMASDPLSLITSLGLQESAWLSVHLLANDIATTGFAPMYAQMVLNLPATLTQNDLTVYWDYIHKYCKDTGIAITGGHTCSIDGLEATIAGGGTMTVVAPFERIRLSKYAKAGNCIIVTKQCALSSSAILAMSFPETVKNKLGKDIYEQSCELFYQTSCLPEGLVAGSMTAVTAMHDVTEGGVLGTIYEMAIASGNGVRILNDCLPVNNAQEAICGLFGIDYRYSIGAGAMVIAVEAEHVANVLAALHESNIEACIVGEFTNKDCGCILEDGGIERPLVYNKTDPYWNAFFEAYKMGWR